MIGAMGLAGLYMTTLKKGQHERRTGICGGAGCSRTPTYTLPYSSRGVLSVSPYMKLAQKQKAVKQ
jgi:hypothetical protein